MTAPRQLDEREFRDLVALDVRDGASPQDSQWLRSPENVERWYEALVSIQHDVAQQLSATQADLNEAQTEMEPEDFEEYKISKAKWKKGATFFKTGVERKLRQAKLARNEHRGSRFATEIQEERDHARREVIRLRKMISDHKRAMDPDDVADQDLTLWAVLDEEPFL